jgi:hypothetical protein
MTAAPEIPADVMAAAREAASFTHDPGFAEVTRAIARAILAERRRCAALLKDPQCDVVPYLMSDAAVDAFFALPSEQPT